MPGIKRHYNPGQSRTLWRLKEQVWGKEGHKERREAERRRRIEEGTKKSTHSDRASIAPIARPQASGHSGGGFRPAGTVLKPHAATVMPPAHPAPMAAPTGPAAASSGNSKTRRILSPEQVEESRQIGLRMRQALQRHEEQARSLLTNPDNGTPSVPPDQDRN